MLFEDSLLLHFLCIQVVFDLRNLYHSLDFFRLSRLNGGVYRDDHVFMRIFGLISVAIFGDNFFSLKIKDLCYYNMIFAFVQKFLHRPIKSLQQCIFSSAIETFTAVVVERGQRTILMNLTLPCLQTIVILSALRVSY